jgi:Chaperone of endosialidase
MKMKLTLFISLFLILVSQHLYSQNVGINSTGAAPNNSAMLDIVSNDMGLLVPRLALVATNNAAPVTGPAISLLVYNTATAGVAPNNVTPGYYYWDGAQWVRFQDANAGDDWHIDGNAGTNSTVNFIGTTDNQNLIIRTNNTEKIRVESGGDVGVGTTTPDAKFHSHQSGTASGDIAILATQGINLSTGITAALFVAGSTDYDIYQYSGGRNALWAPTAIGHNAPTQMLDINGNTRLRAHIYDSNNLAGFDGDVLSRDAGGVVWVDPLTLDDEDWSLLGNAGTNPAVNFWGTTDNVDLVVRTNNTERMRIQSDGTVSIGTELDNNSNIYNRIMNTNTTNAYGIYNYHDGIYTGSTYSQYNYNVSATNSTKYGIYNYINNEGTGTRYGIYNNVYQNSASNSSTYGIRNYLRSYGTSTNYGLYNYHYTSGTGTHYGLYNYLYLSGSTVSTNTYASYNLMNVATSTNTSTIHGEYTSVDYSSGIRYGEYKDMNSNSSYTGTIYGDYNNIDGTGNDAVSGIYNNIAITGTGVKYGTWNQFADVQGTKYGVYNFFPNGTMTGTICGVYNMIQNDATATKYGIRNYISGGNGSLYGSHNAIYPATTNTSSIYGLYSYVSSSGTGAHYGLYVNAAGGTNDYAVYAYAGNSVFNEVGGDYDVRMESDTRTHMFWLDANTTENLVRFGTGSTFSDNSNGSVIAGSTVDYVADFDNGSASGTAIGIGSIEFLLDASARTLINNCFAPTTNGTYDLGYTTTSQYWDDVYADDFVNVSDKRAKENIVDITYGLNEILQLRPVAYKMIEDPMQETKLGLIAQEVLPIVKEAVKTHDLKFLNEKDKEQTLVELDLMGMKYMYIIPVLIKAMQEEDTKVEDLKTKVVEQEQIIQDLKQQNLEILKRLEELENK